MTEESEIDLLYEAARLCGFDRRTGWPERFEVHHFVLLMAGGGLGRKPDEWKRANAQVNDGIEAGTLKTEDVDQGFEEVACDADSLPDHERVKKAVFPKIDRFGRQRFVYYERRKKKPKRYITREACRDWLRAIRKTPPPLVRAWLGDIWQEEAAKSKVGTGKTAPAADSRPGERIDYFRTIWLELDKPARNGGIWKAIRTRAGKNGCPITSTTGNEEFVFQYSDGCTDRLDKSQFQKDMSAVRNGKPSHLSGFSP